MHLLSILHGIAKLIVDLMLRERCCRGTAGQTVCLEAGEGGGIHSARNKFLGFGLLLTRLPMFMGHAFA